MQNTKFVSRAFYDNRQNFVDRSTIGINLITIRINLYIFHSLLIFFSGKGCWC